MFNKIRNQLVMVWFRSDTRHIERCVMCDASTTELDDGCPICRAIELCDIALKDKKDD